MSWIKDMIRRLMMVVWQRRHRVVSAIRSIGNGFYWLYHKIPLPTAARSIIKDSVFLSVDHFILRTDTYQRWVRSRASGSRIHHLLSKPRDHGPRAACPEAPSEPEWKKVTTRKYRDAAHSPKAVVDVIIPVYDGYDATLRCIYSVLTAPVKTSFELIVINDASPNSRIHSTLRALADKGMFTLREHSENAGFVATANEGMALHDDRDVVLLNADTEVYHDWLDRLHRTAHSQTLTGTVTPFSNNSEICSYPYFVSDFNAPLETDFSEIDTLAAMANDGETCHIPTAVGFCMYIRRNLLNDIGYFDTQSFGRGYGEENDFCLRATEEGYEHLLACDTFVRHLGGVSFNKEKKARMRKAWKAVNKKHPGYRNTVAQFIENDPVRPFRKALDLARLHRMSRETNILMVNHALGGGTAKHVKDMAYFLEREEVGVFLLAPHPEVGGVMTLSHPDIPDVPNLTFSMDYEMDALVRTLEALNISLMHVHHVIQFAEGVLDFLPAICHRLRIPYDVTVHDYYMLSPSINLMGHDGLFTEDISAMRPANSTHNTHPVWQWQQQHRSFLAGARQIYVPDSDVQTRMQAHYPELTYQLRPHPEAWPKTDSLYVPYTEGETLRVAVIGAIPEIKGAHVLEALVRDAETRQLPIRYTLIGHSTHPPIINGMPLLEVTGAYEEKDLTGLVAEHRPHLVLVPTIVPETYCYTLSHAWRHGLWPVAFDIGAQATRIKEQAWGSVMPYAWVQDAASINDFLLNIQTEGIEPWQPKPRYLSLLRDYYDLRGGASKISLAN